MPMQIAHLGEITGILTAVCWTVSALTFSVATRRAGSLTVNLFRLLFAMILYMAWSKLMRGLWLPTDATPEAWKWLSVSGLIGFVLGDYFLFTSFAYQSAKVSMLIMSLAPPIATLFGVLILHESFTLLNFIGMILVLTGIAIVILKREEVDDKMTHKLNYPVKGLLLAFGGAAGQGIGAVFSKLGMGSYDPFASSQIRTITGIVGFLLIISLTRNWKRVKTSILHQKALKPLLIGSFFGPFLGVSLSLLSFQHTKVGIASTLIATVPVFILLPSVLFLGEKLNWKEVVGAFLAVGGMFVFFI
jgi:drug/metabolite transporter (DMT)-like permease